MGNFLMGLLGSLMAAEVGAWCRGLAHKIVHATAERMPEKLRPRMLEEWSALLEDIPGDLSKLWMAISLYRKHSVLAEECTKLIDEPLQQQVGLAFYLAKRLFDILVSIGALIAMAPLFYLIAILIKVDSSGSVFHRDVRVGLRGRPFLIWRFRTMQHVGNPATRWAQENDSRISRVGWLLRKTSMDYLPEYINVLKGEMSIIGPRPEWPAFVKYMQKDIPYYGLRHAVRPGMTGWAQIKPFDGASIKDAHMKFQYDLQYVKRLSFWTDMKILVQTVRVVLVDGLKRHGK